MLNAESDFVILWGLTSIHFGILCVTVISLTLTELYVMKEFIFSSSYTSIG
jgi:hypothetical protein